MNSEFKEVMGQFQMMTVFWVTVWMKANFIREDEKGLTDCYGWT